MGGITDQYSGVVLNQNAAYTGSVNSGTVYQDFFLPVDYERGPQGTAIIPDLSGAQIAMVAGSNPINLPWGIDRFDPSDGWSTILTNTLANVPYLRVFFWAQLNAARPLEIPETWLTDRFRLWVTVTSAIEHIYYSAPNPLSPLGVNAYLSPDGSSPITQGGNQASLLFRIEALTADSGTDFLGNSYRSAVVVKSAEAINTVAGDPVAHWLSRPNPSKYAVEALYADVSQNGEPVVVDSILLDPLTPNVSFNVYYTNDGDVALSADDWDNKLWTRVPEVYTARKRDTYYLTQPATAKFFKIEFTNLQAQSYRTKVNAPVQYRRFPSWVLDYFLLQYTQSRTTEDYFVGTSVNVVFDLLEYAYSYSTDGISSGAPQPPALLIQSALELQDQLSADLAQVDTTTLSQISQSLVPFEQQPSNLTSPDFLAGVISNQVGLALSKLSLYPTENQQQSYSVNTPFTAARTRDPLIREKTQPDMFFYLTCRHFYRLSSSPFDNDRAYFAGVRELAFLRDNYAIPVDTPVYWETFGDSFNQIT
jgi:hypothetical protein